MHKVVIIDDELWARKVIKKLVPWTEMNLSLVGEAWDGDEGLELLKLHKPDIVITDMKMPGLDGVDLLKQLESDFAEIKIIAMSGYSDFVYLKQAINSKAVDYLLKPVDPLELEVALKKAIREISVRKNNQREKLSSLRMLDDVTIMKKYIEEQKKIKEALLDFNGERITKIFKRLGEFLESQDSSFYNTVSHDFLQILEVFISKSEFNLRTILPDDAVASIKGNHLSSKMLMDTLDCLYQNTFKKVEKLKKQKKQLNLDSVKEYMNANYTENISLESIANTFYVSKEHLSRRFKTTQGKTLLDYLTSLRMEKAKELILLHDMSIKNVATTIGFHDIAYFYRVFKKYFNVVPGEMRNQYNTTH